MSHFVVSLLKKANKSLKDGEMDEIAQEVHDLLQVYCRPSNKIKFDQSVVACYT